MAETNPNGANKKKCIKCGVIKAHSEFELRKDTNTYRGKCKQCESIRKNKWYENNKFDIKIKYVAKKYGLTERDYFKLVEIHKDLCAICCERESSVDGKSKIIKSLAIDHNHKTGNVRGMLCWRCNALIGYAKENTDILESAIKYIKKYEK